MQAGQTGGNALHVAGALVLRHVAEVLQPPGVPAAPQVVLRSRSLYSANGPRRLSMSTGIESLGLMCEITG